MANFLKALEKTLKNEGFYSNDSQDAGGETIWGIARKKNPQWSGWKIVDEQRRGTGFPVILKTNTLLIEDMHSFYRTEFWNKIQGDNIINQEAAEELFDSAVNMGCHQAIILTQQALFIKPENGIMNATTLNAINQANPYA